MPGELTPEQRRNRARLLIVARAVSALLAGLIAANIVGSIRQGYVRLEVGSRRGPGGDFLLLDSPVGVALGELFLEVFAVFFAMVAISPRLAVRTRLLLPSIAAVLVVATVLKLFFR